MPEILASEQVVTASIDALGRRATYQYEEPYAPFAKMHDLLKLGDDFPRDIYAVAMASIYDINNDAPRRQLVVDMRAALANVPVSISTMGEWAARQDWSMNVQDPLAVESSAG